MVLSVKDMRDLGEFLFTWICAIDRELMIGSFNIGIPPQPPSRTKHRARETKPMMTMNVVWMPQPKPQPAPVVAQHPNHSNNNKIIFASHFEQRQRYDQPQPHQ
jgi:hypothetical protein